MGRKFKQWDSFKLSVCVLNKLCIEMIFDFKMHDFCVNAISGEITAREW